METRREEQIKAYERTLKTLDSYKKELAKPVPKEELILWEAGANMELLDSIDLVTWWSENSIRAYVKGQFSVFQFDALLDEVEQPFIDNGYELELDRSKFCKWEQAYELYFKPIGESYTEYHKLIKVVLKGNACTQVSTGKMVEEKKSVCNMVV